VSRAVLVVLALLATTCTACRGKPRPTYEYEAPVTKVTGGVLVEDPPPADPPPADTPTADTPTVTPTTLPPARPSTWRRGGKQ
jgi:hypothetical protein